MPRKQIPIYATQSDLSTLLNDVCSERQLEFVVAGLFDQPTLTVLNDLGLPLPFTTYLAFDKGLSAETRLVPQRNGPAKYAVDQMANPQTVVLDSGGLVDRQRLIAGQIGTATVNKQSEEIYALFAKVVRRRFEKIKSYYVGPEAIRLFDLGTRLTPTAKSSEVYDLVR
ncbi:MAG TPA: hypothetical protein DCQ94_08975 [Nitrospira sp.]|nr:hypothetical protein [Nitrospira sp.]